MFNDGWLLAMVGLAFVGAAQLLSLVFAYRQIVLPVGALVVAGAINLEATAWLIGIASVAGGGAGLFYLVVTTPTLAALVIVGLGLSLLLSLTH